MADLKPCPFCGGEAEVTHPKTAYWIECKVCGCEGACYDKLEYAIEAWNTRKPMEAVVAELEKGMKESEKDNALFQIASALGEMRAFEYAIKVVRNGGKE